LDKQRRTYAQNAGPIGLALEGFEAAREIAPMVAPVTNAAQTMGATDEQGNSKTDSQHDATDDFANSQQAGEAQFSAVGGNSQTYDADYQALLAANMPTMKIPGFLQELTSVASSCGQDVQGLLPLAVALYQRNPGDDQYVFTILHTIGNYEAKDRGLGLFQTALAAAKGQPFQEQLTAQRQALMGNSGDIGQGIQASNDLEQAITGIIQPNSELRALRGKYNNAKMQLDEQKQQLAIQWMQVKTLWDTQKEQYLTGVVHNFNEKFPGLARNPLFGDLMRLIEGIASASGVWAALKNTAAFGNAKGTMEHGQPEQAAPSGFMGGRSSLNISDLAIRLAQAAPQPYAAGGYSATPGAYAPDPTQTSSDLNQTTNTATQTQNGQAPSTLAPTQQQNAQQNGAWNAFMQLHNAASGEVKALETYHQTMVSQLSQGGTDGGGGDDPMPYMTPQQISVFTQSLNEHATKAYQLCTQAMQAYTAAKASQAPNAVAAAGLEQQAAQLQQWQAQVQNTRVSMTALAVCGPVEQQLRMLKPYLDYYQQQIDYATQAMGGVGMDEFVRPYLQMCFQASTLHTQAAQKFASMSASITEPAMKNFCHQMSMTHQMKAQMTKQQGMLAMSKMAGLGGQNGGPSVSDMSIQAGSGKFTRTVTARDIEAMERKADDELEDYFNDLYKGTPGSPEWGEVLEHPDAHRDELTDDVKAPEGLIRHHKINLSDD
jgi:hypothetical protein